MKLSIEEPFYRKASATTPKEDGIAINMEAGLFVVSDGVSGPYSPSNSGIKYQGGITGGQMVTKTICDYVASGSDIDKVLTDANRAVLANHLASGKDPAKEAVAGASVAACQVGHHEIKLILIGDCFVLYRDDKGFHFLTNFNQAAFDFEDRGNEAFAKCLQEAEGNKGRAWDLYFSYFSEKQFFRANKNIGNGGHAVLNGNPDLSQCYTIETISLLSSLKWILLGTDGLLATVSTNPKNRDAFIQQLGQMYSEGGLPAIIDWRDKEDYQPHIGVGSNPEASAIELKFG